MVTMSDQVYATRERMIPAKPISTTASQPHGIGVSSTEEGFGCGGAPVDEELIARGSQQSESSDVHRLVRVDGHDATQAQIDTVSTE